MKNIRVLRRNAIQAMALYDQAKHQALQASTPPKSSLFDEWDDDPKPKSEIKKITTPLPTYSEELNRRVAEHLKSNLPNETKEFIKGFMEIEAKGGVFPSDLRPEFERRSYKEVVKAFPQDSQKLHELYVRVSQIEDKRTAAQDSVRRSKTEDERKRKIEEFQKLNHEKENLNELIKAEAQRGPRQKFLNEFFSVAYDSSYGHNSRRSIFENVREFEKAEKASRQKQGGSQRASGLLGAFGGVGTASSSVLGSQIDLRGCQKQFGFSEEEFKYLENGFFLMMAKVSTSDSFSCSGLKMQIDDQTFYEIKEKFGGIPQGICKLVKQQNSNLDQLIPVHTDNSKDPDYCGGYIDSKTKVTSEGKAAYFEHQVGTKKYRAPFNVITKYPDFRLVKVLDQQGQIDENLSLEVQGIYNRVHPSSSRTSTPHLTELDLQCRENESSRNASVHVFCDLRSSAMQARLNMTLNEGLCSRVSLPRPGSASKSQVGTR